MAWASRWAITDLVQTWANTTCTVVITTNKPCHVTLRWTEEEVRTHLHALVRRGLRIMADPYFCFVNWKQIEQVEPGDTLLHTFIWPGWFICLSRFFAFVATIAGQPTASQWGIFEKHMYQGIVELTFKPDPHPETTSVDGMTRRFQLGSSWYSLCVGVGTDAWDAGDVLQVHLDCHNVLDEYREIRRIVLLFDTSLVPKDCVIKEASLSLYCYQKWDFLSANPTFCVVASAPASNTSLVPADYQKIDDYPLSNAVAYNDIAIPSWVTFTFNTPGLAAIAKQGITKLALREYSYDIMQSPPPWVSAKDCAVNFRSADFGSDAEPLLWVKFDAG